LYWHFRNKQELLDEMARAVATPIPAKQLPATGALTWDHCLRLVAQAWRQAMLSHRDGALLLTAARPADDQVADLERLLDALVAAGFPPADAMRGFFTITNYVLGAVLEQQRGPRGDTDDPRGPAQPGPTLTAAREAVLDRDVMFEHGLTLILEGMRAQLSPAWMDKGGGRGGCTENP
jgi:TetR/AcrR family tetracycline transcriptional repressor